MEPITENEEFYRQEENWVERIHRGLTSTDDYIKLTNILLARILTALGGYIPPEDGGNGGNGGNGGVGGRLHLETRTIFTLEGATPRDTQALVPVRMAEATRVNRILVHVNNVLNQTVRYEVAGGPSDDVQSLWPIKEDTLESGDSIIFALTREEWMPYITVRATPLASPTSGSISASVILQEWVNG